MVGTYAITLDRPTRWEKQERASLAPQWLWSCHSSLDFLPLNFVQMINNLSYLVYCHLRFFVTCSQSPRQEKDMWFFSFVSQISSSFNVAVFREEQFIPMNQKFKEGRVLPGSSHARHTWWGMPAEASHSTPTFSVQLVASPLLHIIDLTKASLSAFERSV